MTSAATRPHPLLPFDLAQRRLETAPGTPLGALADGLSLELTPLLDPARDLPLPSVKARLTRIGGRCPVHGVYLEFDPWAPHDHRCRLCDRVYRAPEHDDWWAMGAQLYTAERAVHAAALHAMRGDPAHRALSERILGELSARYRTYPLRDNALGPTRPFFSTYLESIWLLNVCHALALLELTGPTAIGSTVRSALIEPSRALVSRFFEHRSNRQVWNAAAVVAASVILGDRRPLDRYRFGSDGLESVAQAFDQSGAWYEGENYHLFAHRGLWYGVQLLRALGGELSATALVRYRHAFLAPFGGLLPDETFPSRRDSQYQVSIRQWRNAEYLELGFAESGDARLAGLLRRVYDGTVTRLSDARARSTADGERNEPPALLTRASGSWRALLMASAAPLPHATWAPHSVSRPAEGLAVIRRDRGRVYVALEGSDAGGGHGHPDRLGLTLQTGANRWLDDPGTGSYVDRSLFWYRSTLAHHAPLVNGRSQHSRDTRLTHADDRGGAGWVRKAGTIDDGVSCERAIIVCDGYLVDVLRWQADREVTITLPVAAHVPPASVQGAVEWHATTRAGAGGQEDGFDFLERVQATALADDRLSFERQLDVDGDRVRIWYAAPVGSTLVHAAVPGAPGEPEGSRLLLECKGTSGCLVGVWEWSTAGAGSTGLISAVRLDPHGSSANEPYAEVTTIDGTTAAHSPAAHGWHIALTARGARSSIDLEGEQAPAPPEKQEGERMLEPTRCLTVPRVPHDVPAIDQAFSGANAVTLGAQHYVETDEPYGESNVPRATVELACTEAHLVIRVTVVTGHAVVSPGGTPELMPPNPLDNEHADVNADGVQWYIGARGGTTWWRSELAVPVAPNTLRRTVQTPADSPLRDTVVTASCRWLPNATGWMAQFVVPLADLPADACRFNLIVNERPPEWQRRRGQLRLAGGGFFGYLRGDRDDAGQCALGIVVPPPAT